MATSEPVDRVMYPGGHAFDVEAIGLAVDLSCRGFAVTRRGQWLHVEPADTLTTADMIAIKAHRDELLRITDYIATCESWSQVTA